MIMRRVRYHKVIRDVKKYETDIMEKIITTYFIFTVARKIKAKTFSR